MAIYSNNIIEGMKKTADIYGAINEAQVSLMTYLDPQWKNAFEILIYPQVLDLSLDTLKAVAFAALDTTIARLHIQDITVPFIEFEYEDVNGMKHVKDIKHPEEIEITFIENDIGLVRNYLQYWMNQIAVPNTNGFGIPSGASLSTGSFTAQNVDPALTFTYSFKDKQQSAKKNAKIIMQMGTGLPSPAVIQIEGLRYKSIDSWDLSQGSEEPLLIKATFAVDVIRIMTPFNFI